MVASLPTSVAWQCWSHCAHCETGTSQTKHMHFEQQSSLWFVDANGNSVQWQRACWYDWTPPPEWPVNSTSSSDAASASSSSSSSAFLTLSSSSIASSSSARFSTSVNENATLDASTPPPLKSELVRFSVRNSTKRSTSSFGNDGSANGASTEPPYALAPMMLPSCASALRPHFVSKLNAVSPRPLAPTVPRRSPCVSAPSDSSLRATADAKRRSPPTDEMRNLYSGAEAWFDRCDRPNCWIALSADHGSSSVMCTRRRRFVTRAWFSAWSEIPDDAASEIIATSFRPLWNSSRS
mmetsp:Transcript_7569/g.23809  ORF Transcript_7569/g.23809 Transcript_7569/m.23809 type:complete len:295 (+) Transcript_7569:1373-2257(+)